MGNVKERSGYRVETMRCFTTHIVRVQEGEERKNGAEAIFDKKTSEHFPGLILKITNHRIRKPSESHIG